MRGLLFCPTTSPRAVLIIFAGRGRAGRGTPLPTVRGKAGRPSLIWIFFSLGIGISLVIKLPDSLAFRAFSIPPSMIQIIQNDLFMIMMTMFLIWKILTPLKMMEMMILFICHEGESGKAPCGSWRSTTVSINHHRHNWDWEARDDSSGGYRGGVGYQRGGKE